MGKRSQSRLAASAWLPGFEPEGFEGTALASGQLIITPISVAPPVPPTDLAVAAATVALEAVMASSTIVLPTTADALSIIGTEELEQLRRPVSAGLDSSEFEEPAAEKSWPAFNVEGLVPPSSTEARCKLNIDAIKLCKELDAQDADPTPEQRHQLLRYIGWGGLARIFEHLDKGSLLAQQRELERILSEDEFKSARASTPTAYYTDPTIVAAMWDAVRRMGFNGGRVIEPAAATGLFLAGMPADIASKSEITAVELDVVSGGILKRVFGGLGVNVHVGAIEKAPVPHGFYDLAISNVPFAEHRALDIRKAGYTDWSLHNYFFGKAVDLVRPGGLIAFVTSRHTLDSQTMMHRKWLDAHAEFVGAVRLPKNAFKRQAGTEVVADIIFMRKRESPMFGADSAWTQVGNAPAHLMRAGQSLTAYNSFKRDYVEVARPINEYFARQPGMVIGELEFQSTQYGRQETVPVFDGTDAEFAKRLSSCMAEIPQGIYKPAPKRSGTNTQTMVLDRVVATHEAKPGSFVLHKGAIHISEGTEWVDVDTAFKGLTRERLLGMIRVKEAARALIEQQAASEDEAQFKSLQLKLNTVYDSFVAKFGNLRDRANVRVFRTDPECPLILSLEDYDEDAEKFFKADIFSKRTVGRREPPQRVDTYRDAMLVSLALHGRIVIPEMARRMGVDGKSVVQGITAEALAYLDPEDGTWKPADEYLSGHIRNKIAAASAAGAQYRRNVDALEAVLPKDLGPAEVEVRLAAPWVPTEVVEQFATELVLARPTDISVIYDAASATWTVKTQSSPERTGERMLSNGTWGTADRCALVLLEAALNQQPPKITRTGADQKTYVDRRATLAAREKYEAIKAEFKRWAYADDARRDRLLRIYNDEFNVIRDRVYDGRHLLLPGMSKVVEPYRHQLDAVWRILTGGNTLLAHRVGAGKTFTMAAAAMELRRLGKARKPCITTPNHLLEQVAGDIVRFYPNARVLMATKDDLLGDRRREFVARIATGDWDAVVMTQSTFERLPLRPETAQRFLNGMLDQTRLSLAVATESQAKRSVKQCEKLIKALEAKLERAMADVAKDDFVYFDELGIDQILYDECHVAKSLMRISKMPTVAGLPNVSSNRAFDLWAKTSWIMEQRGGREEGVVFASATPICNSIAEAHVMQRYLQPKTLKAMGLYEFDAWAGTFGEVVQSMEIAPDGSGYRLVSRFARFVNVSDLMSIVRMTWDIKTASMIKLPTPAIQGGKPKTVESPQSDLLKAYTDSLVERAERVRSGAVQPKDDNMLAITGCGRKAALDMRLVDPTAPFDPNGKIARIRDQVVRIWKETAERKGTQIVFCDLSTPKANGFSFYNDLRDRLITEGIPAEEIEFIHDHDTDAAKDKLFRRMRAGLVRVLLGSTDKLGIGTNVQRRLRAVHQADAPWRPDQVIQRDGRADRPGNTWDEIELLRYVTTGSFDAFMWSLLEYKAKFIEQIMSSTTGLRTVEDIVSGALSYAEIKAIASGNPLVLEKATVDQDVLRYSLLQDEFRQDRWRWSATRTYNREAIAAIEARMPGILADAKEIAAQLAHEMMFKPVPSLAAVAATEATLAQKIGRCVVQASRIKGAGLEVDVGTVGGMTLVVRRDDRVEVDLQSQNGIARYTLDRDGVVLQDIKALGALVLERIEALVGEPERQAKSVERMSREIADIERRLSQPFEHEQKLQDLRARQRQIEIELDLDKDEAGTEAADAQGDAAQAVPS